jgi:hypothetical protein
MQASGKKGRETKISRLRRNFFYYFKTSNSYLYLINNVIPPKTGEWANAQLMPVCYENKDMPSP